MKEVALIRFGYTPQGTFGILRVPTADFTCYTVERPWLNNEPHVSCIPAGRYLLAPAIHHIGTPDPADDYPCYEVTGVPGRSAIHIHVANHAGQLEGCIAPGRGLGVVDYRWAVTLSQFAFNSFMRAMNGEPGMIGIYTQAPFDWRGWDIEL